MSDTELRKYSDGEKEDYRISYGILKAFLTPVGLAMYRPRLHGNEKIPKEGGVILALNHRCNGDPAFICLGTKRMIHFLAKKELFEGSFAWFFRLGGTIPVDRVHGDKKAMATAEDILHKGGIVGIFPEGTRNRTEEPILPLKFGAVRIAQKTGVPIIPVVSVGPYKPFGTPIDVYYCDPMYVAEGDDLEKANKKLRNIMTEVYVKNNENKNGN